jgi:hypothetical protein
LICLNAILPKRSTTHDQSSRGYGAEVPDDGNPTDDETPSSRGLKLDIELGDAGLQGSLASG